MTAKSNNNYRQREEQRRNDNYKTYNLQIKSSENFHLKYKNLGQQTNIRSVEERHSILYKQEKKRKRERERRHLNPEVCYYWESYVNITHTNFGFDHVLFQASSAIGDKKIPAMHIPLSNIKVESVWFLLITSY